MASTRHSARLSGGDQLASKRQRVAELQQQITAERAKVQSANNRTKELHDAHRILEAARQCSRMSTMFAAVRDLPDGQGDSLLADHAAVDRERKKQLTRLEQNLASELERQRLLQQQLEQLRQQIPAAGQARQQLLRAQNDPAVQRSYTAMLEHFGELTHLYNVVEKLMVVANYPWLESPAWMHNIRPAYHELAPPSHVLRADLQPDSESSGEEASLGSSSPL